MSQELVAEPAVRPVTTVEAIPAGQTNATASAVRRRLLPELLLVGLGYLIYSQVRGLAGGRVSDAFANAYHIIDIERAIGIYGELTWQQWVLPHAALVDIFNIIYFYAFFPLIIPTAVWLFWKRPHVYALGRTAFLASGGIAVCFFLALPTAPPRLLDVGFIDTLNHSFTPTYSSIPGVNHYAALPSMHVGWTFLLAIALVLALPQSRWRWLAFAIPFAMFLSTIVTGNHWFLDAALGLIVAGAGLAIAVKVRRYTEQRASAQQLGPGWPRRSSP